MAAFGPELPGLQRLQRIGAGGFGTVYRAWQPEFGRWVAVKVLSGTVDDADDERRFERERLATGSLSAHPAIVTVHDHGVSGDGHPYIVMELMEGGSLSARLGAGPLSPEDVTGLGVTLAGALAAAHETGVLHRDVKPENVLFSAYGQPALADFGIARLPGVTTTRSGVITASLAHAPPEVLDGRPPDDRADVYGLASTLWTASTGYAPFTRDVDEPIAALIARITTSPPPDVVALGVPGPLADVLARGLAKAPDDRQASAAVFAEELRQAESALGFRVTPLVVATTRAAGDAGPTPGDEATRPREPAPARSRRRGVVVTAAVAALLAGTAGAWALTRGAPRAEEVPVASSSPSAPAATGGMPVAGVTAGPGERPDEAVRDSWPTSTGRSATPDDDAASPVVVDPSVTGPATSSGDEADDDGVPPAPDDPAPTAGPTSEDEPAPTQAPSPTVTHEPTSSPSPTPSPNRDPVAAYTTRVAAGTDTVTFDASRSSDPDGDVLTYRWTFNDGTAAKSGRTVTHSFSSTADNTSSVWTVTLVVEDPDGAIDSVDGPASVSMPDLHGMNSTDAFQAARGAGLRPLYSPAWDDGTAYPSYTVWSQYPRAGSTMVGDANARIVVWEEDTCAANPDETFDHWWCYEEPPPSPTLSQPYY